MMRTPHAPRRPLPLDGRLPLPDVRHLTPGTTRGWLAARASAELAAAAAPTPDPDARRRAVAAHTAATYATRRAALAMRAATRRAAADRFAAENGGAE